MKETHIWHKYFTLFVTKAWKYPIVVYASEPGFRYPREYSSWIFSGNLCRVEGSCPPPSMCPNSWAITWAVSPMLLANANGSYHAEINWPFTK